MPRQKTNNTVKSISFQNYVLEALENRCKQEKIQVSTFVNNVIRKIVISEFQFYRQMTKQHASEMYKYQKLMETSPDKPRGDSDG